MMRLSDFLSKLLRASTVAFVFLFFTLISFAPIAQQTSSPQPFPSAIILYPQPFEEIRDQNLFIVSLVSIPEEIANEYFLSSLFVFANNEWLEVYPLQDQLVYDPITRSYVGYYLSVWEGEVEGTVLIGLQALFGSHQHQVPTFVALDTRLVSLILSQEETNQINPQSSLRPHSSMEPSMGRYPYCVEDPLYCVAYMGICFCFPDDGGTPPPNDGGTEPPDDDDNNNNDDDDDNNNGDRCNGISYFLHVPLISGRIVQPSEEEVIVGAGDTMTLKAEGAPNPDRDRRISRSYNDQTKSCSSTENEIAGPPLSFIWRFWKDNGDGSFSRINDTLVLIKVGREIQWQVPSSEVGTYWIELVVDDDPHPDREIPGEKKECGKCSVISNADDPAVRDWVKVKVFAKDDNADLDCDSDNDGFLEENDEEEKKEDINPGCFVSLEEEERLVAKIEAKSNGHKVRLFWHGQGQVTVYDEKNNQPLQSPVEWSVPIGSSCRNFKVKGEGSGMIWFELIHLDAQDKIIVADKVVFTVPWEIVLVKEQGNNFTFTKMLPEVYISSPHPTIHLQQSQITIETLPDGSNIVALWLQGIIRSRACDITPKGIINSFALYTNDDPSEPIIVSNLSDWDSNGIADVQVLKSFEESLTRPYPFEAYFNVKVPIGGFDEGIHNLRLEVKDPVTGSIGTMEMEYEISFNESKNKWEVTKLSFIVVDEWEEFYPLAIRVGTSNAKFSENFLITSLNGVKRRVLKGPDNHWYVADEQGNRIDILFLTYDDSETLPLPPPVMLSIDGESPEEAMLPIYGLLSDSSNPYLQAAEFVLGIIVGFAEGGWNLVSGTAQGLWTVAKVIYAHRLEYTQQGKIEKRILKIIAPDFVQELEGITIKWDTLMAVAKVVQNMLKDTEIYHAVANGSGTKSLTLFPMTSGKHCG